METDPPPHETNAPQPPDGTDGTDVLETVPCPLCRSERFALLRTARDLMYGSGESFNLVRCLDCRHVYVNPRPGPQQILRYYPDDYAPHHNLPDGPALECTTPPAASDPPWYLSGSVRRIPGLRAAYYWLTDSNDVLLPRRPDRGSPVPRVLELGCSDGDYLLQLQSAGWDTVGIEPAAAPAQRACQRGLDVRCSVLEPEMFPADSFDAVCAWHVIEHLHDPQCIVAELARILKPGGELLLSLPNYGCWEPRVFGEYWYLNQPPIHLHHFTPQSLRWLLASHGFEQIDCQHQRNLSNVVGSVALWLRDRDLFPRLADRLWQYPDSPALAGQLMLALPARVLAACRQGGRLTVRARGPASTPDREPLPTSVITK